jgi:RHS repeat-associated protein
VDRRANLVGPIYFTRADPKGTSTLGFSYDTANRRSTLTLSNGVNMSYTYDNDSRVTGITYQFNANTLGNLTHTYDSLGRRTQVGGSFAQTGLPGSISSATYDAANELTNWNGTPISYDLNGNMLSDGANAFSWNARNQVATLNSVSLQYDGFGRRTKNLQNTSFLFDGANAVQELSGSTATANLISGGIDEIFTRADSSGAYTPLKDALGSTIALVDASGNLATQYSYDPFGNTTFSGATNTNGFQYTGRENEGNGLYFYRNRYYSPVLGRFVNEDPLGFAGSGPNFYAYVFDSPTNLVDPFGLEGEWWNPHSYDFSHYNPWDTVQDVGNVAEAFTDTITFGSASRLNDALGAGGMVDRCGIGHKLGTAAGIVASIAIGGSIGAEAAESNAGEQGFEFSHWIPDRMGGPRSIYNGNFVSQKLHYLTDFSRYPAPAGAALRWGPKLPAVAQQILRIPWVYDGAAAGAVYGEVGAVAGRNCGCH